MPEDPQHVADLWATAHFSNQYNNGDPVRPATAQELSELVDRVVELGDEACSQLTIVVGSINEEIGTILSVGLKLNGAAGSIRFNSLEGTFFSKGHPTDSDDPISYLNFGNEEFFPADSVIDLSKIKSALINFYNRSFLRPDNIQWQGLPDDYNNWYYDSNEEITSSQERELDPSADIDPWGNS